MVNKAIIIGNVGSAPEVKSTQGGQSVANFTVATNENWTDKQGQKQQRTEWHRIVVWGKLAEICAQYVKKGMKVYVEGKIQTREWQDKNGEKRYTTEIQGFSVQFLSSSKTEDGQPAPAQNSNEVPNDFDL